MGRISIAGLLGVVAFFAIGLAALIHPSDVWAGVIFTIVIGTLLASILGMLLRGWRRGGWLGFAIFGWGYLLLGSVSGLGMMAQGRLLTDSAANWVFEKSHPFPEPESPPIDPSLPPIPPSGVSPFEIDPPAPAPGTSSAPSTPTDPVMLYAPWHAYRIFWNGSARRRENAKLIGYLLSIPLFAGFGAILGAFLARPLPTIGPTSADRQLADSSLSTVSPVP